MAAGDAAREWMVAQEEVQFWQRWPGTRVFAARVLAFSVVWHLLSEGRVDSWLIGLPAVLAAALLSATMLPPVRISLPALVRFVGFFLRESLLGGIDVAVRALRWRMPLEPGLVVHGSRMPDPLARVVVVTTASLTPGTLIVDLDGRTDIVHALDTGSDVRASLAGIEERVAGMFLSQLRGGPPHRAGAGG